MVKSGPHRESSESMNPETDCNMMFYFCAGQVSCVPRLLRTRVGPIFEAKGYEFHVEYIRAIRNWKDSLPTVSSLSGAFRRRDKLDEAVVPHSYTYIQRSRFLG